jgi:hypothetical protein
MQQGQAVYLSQSPSLRGNVSKIEGDRFQVTWHAFMKDRPEAKLEPYSVREASTRARYWYTKGETNGLVLGVPE